MITKLTTKVTNFIEGVVNLYETSIENAIRDYCFAEISTLEGILRNPDIDQVSRYYATMVLTAKTRYPNLLGDDLYERIKEDSEKEQ